jgi:hypothetical protein
MKGRRYKPVQVDQYQYGIQNSGTTYDFFYIDGQPFGRPLPRPHSVINANAGWLYRDGQMNMQRHPVWADLIGWAPWLPQTDPQNPSEYDSSLAFGSAMDSMTCKDTRGFNDAPEQNNAGFSGQFGLAGMAYFPVVYRISPVHMKTSGVISNDIEMLRVCPFRVVATSWPWQPAGDSDYTPSYRQVTINRNFSDSTVTMQIYIDTKYLADDGNTYMSILASVLAVLPFRWAGSIQQTGNNMGTLEVYITIAPAISEASYEEHVSDCVRIMGDMAPMGDACFAFEGASLGLAVMAAIMGMPPIMYTGYNSQVGTDQILTDDPDQPIQQVALGANFVEPVDDVEHKVSAAVQMGVPLIIPLNVSWYTEPTRQALYRGVSRALGLDKGRKTLLALAARKFAYPVQMQKTIALANNTTNWAATMSNFIYTTAKRAAGLSYDALPSYILAAANLSDVQILAAHTAVYMWPPNYQSIVIDNRGDNGVNVSNYAAAASQLSMDSNRVRRATELAQHAGTVDLKASRQYEMEMRRRMHAGPEMMPQTDDPWDLDNLNIRAVDIYKNKKKKGKGVGKSGGKIKRRKTRKAAPKKAAPKRKKAAKKKKKAKRKKPSVADGAAPPKRKKAKSKKGKSKKRKTKGKKKTVKKSKKRKTKKSSKRTKAAQRRIELGGAAGVYRGIGSAASGYPMDKRIGAQIPMTRLNRRAKESALSFMDPSARAAPLGGRMTARQQVRQQMLARMGAKTEKSVRFS